MKKNLSLKSVLLLMLLPCIATAQEIKFYNEVHDFGEIKQGETITVNYFFKNTGNQALIISSVKPTCGCTAPEWSKEPITPGECGVITLNFNSAGKQGIQDKTCTITSNSASKEPVVLHIKGVIDSPKNTAENNDRPISNSFKPSSQESGKICNKFSIDQTNVNIGRISSNVEKTAIVKIENKDATNLMLSYNDISAKGKPYSVSLVPYEWRNSGVNSKTKAHLICIKPGESAAVLVKVKNGEKSRKEFNDTVMLNANTPDGKLALNIKGKFD